MMSATKLSRIIFVLVFLAVLLLNHYYISKNFVGETINNNIIATNVLIDKQNIDSAYSSNDLESVYRIGNLKFRIKEMLQIRGSVSNELKNLESKRQAIQSEISLLSNQLAEAKYQLNKKQLDLNRVHLSIEQAEYAQKEASMRNQPFLVRPIKLLPLSTPNNHEILNQSDKSSPSSQSSHCTMNTCFDYSRCSLTSGFPIYIYSSVIKADSVALTSDEEDVLNWFKLNPHNTFDPSVACVYIAVVYMKSNIHNDKDLPSIQSQLTSLDYWSIDGANHIIVNLNSAVDLVDSGLKPHRALVLQTKFSYNSLREDFDIIIPPLVNKQFHLSSSMSLNCPAKRDILISYQGFLDESRLADIQSKEIIKILKEMEIKANEEIVFDFNCSSINCTSYLAKSTFSLVLPLSTERWYKSHPSITKQVIRLLSFNVIPILIGGNDYRLPFYETIDWKKVALIIPIPRITEIHFIAKSISDADIINMRRQGRLIFDRYLASPQSVVNSCISFLRSQRLYIPALPVKEEIFPFLYNSTYSAQYLDSSDNNLINQDTEPDENLGPIEPPFPSPSFYRNFSLTLCHSYDLWNSAELDPFVLYPSTPFDPVLPSEAKFIGSGYGFRPIGQGTGGTGKEFSEALGGNWPKEQFTIVIPTYEREAILIDSLQRLRGLPYLNKILIIWNSPKKPSVDLQWPDLGVPINVIEADQNSLNNRFKPYQQIETDAILSMDDDVHLRHDEIIFGFRVWREARDRIVGFPGRYHAWDNNFDYWLYNSNYSCELSMVLTGAAFFHKYYTYFYTYSMDKAIRERVDEYMNCEDIAMNFLVSHLTRKPPLKVTSRWTFRCPGCQVSLFENDSHFQERHKCINYFTSLYGYNPLLQTQFRVDSVLFKTRIPHDKQKCFKFL